MGYLSSKLDSIFSIGTVIAEEYKTSNFNSAIPNVNESAVAGAGPMRFRPFNYNISWAYVKGSAEMISILTAITEDILSDGWQWIGSKSAKDKAKKFAMKVNLKSLINSFLWDVLVTGDGYLYKFMVSPEKIQKIISNNIERIPEELSNDFVTKVEKEIENIAPSIFGISNLKYVPSSTMFINFDKYGDPLYYEQNIRRGGSSYSVKFRADEIAHFKLYELDGKMYGFTPVQALFRELQIMSLVKSSMLRGFSGHPDMKFYILPDDRPGTPNYELMKKALAEAGNPANRYKSLLFTGNVQVIDAGQGIKDMEFEKTAKYITEVMVMTYGVPSSRLSGIFGQDKGKSSTQSSEGYYRKISHTQDLVEDFLNVNIFQPFFKVDIKFNKTYKQDEVREVQTEKVKTDIVEQRLKLGLVNTKWAFDYLRIPEDGRGSGEPEFGDDQFNQDKEKDKKLMSDNPDKLTSDNKRQSTQLENKN